MHPVTLFHSLRFVGSGIFICTGHNIPLLSCLLFFFLCHFIFYLYFRKFILHLAQRQFNIFNRKEYLTYEVKAYSYREYRVCLINCITNPAGISHLLHPTETVPEYMKGHHLNSWDLNKIAWTNLFSNKI